MNECELDSRDELYDALDTLLYVCNYEKISAFINDMRGVTSFAFYKENTPYYKDSLHDVLSGFIISLSVVVPLVLIIVFGVLSLYMK